MLCNAWSSIATFVLSKRSILGTRNRGCAAAESCIANIPYIVDKRAGLS